MTEEVKLTIGDLKKKLSYLTDVVEGGGVFTDDTVITFASHKAGDREFTDYNSVDIVADEERNDAQFLFGNSQDDTKISVGWSLKKFSDPEWLAAWSKEKNAKLA